MDYVFNIFGIVAGTYVEPLPMYNNSVAIPYLDAQNVNLTRKNIRGIFLNSSIISLKLWWNY